MKMNNRLTWFVALILSNILISSAQGATPIEEVLQTFTACNGEFFYSIKNNKGSISKIAPLIENERNASFAVENRAVSGKNAARFSSSADVFGLHLLGYFDEVSSITPKEQYYYWGFFVAENPDEVRTRLTKYIKNYERLKKEEGTFSRLEMHDGKSWVAIESPQQFSGKTPGSYVERVFLIEKSDNDKFPGTRLSCSIQGPVTDIVIADARPDLPSKDYPIRPKYSGQDFDSIPLNSGVQKITNGLLKTNIFKPKFKTAALRYRIINKGQKEPGNERSFIETYQVTEEGLIKKREIYSSSFFVDRLLLWNLVQLKSKLSTSEVSLTREIKVKLPTSLESGQLFETEVVSGEEYDERINRNVCTIGDRFAANEVHKLLTGSAIKVDCVNSAAGTSSQLVYLDELGIFIRRSSINKEHIESLYEVLEFNSDKLAENRP